MASVILKTAGAAVGNFLLPGIGGAVLGGLGGNLGNLIDAQLGIGPHVTGPRLDNFAVQDSRYGAAIPIVYGNARVAGNVIWSTDLIQTQHDSSVGGKGGGSGVATTTYTYSVHCAVGICAGPIAGITTIWADSTAIYQNGVWTSGVCDSATIYTGAAGQAADPFMQSILGAGNVPAYTGLAYIVFDNLQLANFGNRLPNLTSEIAAAAATASPVWTGGVDAAMAQRTAGVQGGTMLPIVLSGGAAAQTVLQGGYGVSGGNATFIAATYDVTGVAPALLARAVSAAFSCPSPVDCAWALAPDGRFVVCYIQSSTAPTHSFAIYDSETQSFGAVAQVALAAGSSPVKQIAWLDALRFVIDDSSGGVRGVRVLARAGMGVIDLGFTPLWGTGSASSTALFYGAQFTPYAGGLLAYAWTGGASSLLTLQARSLTWRGTALSAGAAYAVVSGLALGTGSGGHARFLQTAADEWTLFYGNVTDMRMLSFEPSASAAAITRPWQIVPLDFGTGTTNFPVFYGDRLIVVQRASSENVYRLSEITLNAAGFALTVDGAQVSNGNAVYVYFAAIRLDGQRLLCMAMGGFTYDIGQFGIMQRNATGALTSVVADILTRAGYAAADCDLSGLNGVALQGYVLQDTMSARAALEPLQAYAPFDLIESAGQLKAVPRGGASSAVLPAAERRAVFDGKKQPPSLLTQRGQEMDLPREVTVDFIDPARNFEVNSARARRLAGHARASQKISLPIVCAAATAKQIAEARLYAMWAERDLIKLTASRAFFALDPADVVDLGDGSLLRIAAVTQSGGLMQVEGFPSYAPALQSAAQADGGTVAAATVADGATILYAMDLPLLRADDDQPGLYVAAAGGGGWKSAALLRSTDGVTYASVGSVTQAATAGFAASVLPDGPGCYPDNAGLVLVQLVSGELSSCAWIDLTNGTNAAALGGEIIQFQTATLIGPGLYLLSALLRGRRGTESATATHVLGEPFVLLQTGAVDFLPAKLSDRNRAYDFRALTPGQSLNDAQDVAFTYGIKTLCPLAPVNVRGVRANGSGSDLTVTWTRRARLNAEWVDYVDVPLDEPQELYELDIMNGATVVRALTGLTSPLATYTAAQQTADWGASVPARLTVNVYQVSARYGNGAVASATV